MGAIGVSMAIGAEAVRSTELGIAPSTELGTGSSSECGSLGKSSRGLWVLPKSPGKQQQAMDANKYEKSFDNRSAALVSRERRAPRAQAERKSLEFHALESTNIAQTARGAQVSRAARGPFAGQHYHRHV